MLGKLLQPSPTVLTTTLSELRCYHATMIVDGYPLYDALQGDDIKNRALRALIGMLEQKTNGHFYRDTRAVPFERPDLADPLALAERLKEAGVLTQYGRSASMEDEPPTRSWYALCNVPSKHQVGGTTWHSDEDALLATLAEGVERFLWFSQEDYFMRPQRVTENEIAKYGPYISPRDFVGFSEEQRAQNPKRTLREDARYLWIQGRSLTSDVDVYIPAQTAIGVRLNQKYGYDEPQIRQQTTIGLATWPTLSGARLAGALEVIEREAYMVWWLNQLKLPRISLVPLCTEDDALARAVALCTQYRLRPHVIQLITDAPTHAVAVILEDTSGHAPLFTIGLKAHRSINYAVQKALTEALRARRGYRVWEDAGNSWNDTPVEEIGHRDRLYYWGKPENAEKLRSLLEGKEIGVSEKPWDGDTIEQQLERVLKWCSDRSYDCISVSLSGSKKNVTPWHIEMVVIPQLHPPYLIEQLRLFGGTRLKEVPLAFGYQPLKEPHVATPHPFS